MRPTVLVFRKRLLGWSETFVAAQARALERYRPVFVGYRLEEPGAAYLGDADRVVMAEHARVPALSKVALKTFGWVTPAWRRALEAREPTVLHAHFGVNTGPALAVARTLGVPVVVTFHGMDITVQRPSRKHRRERERLFRRASRIVAVSRFIADRLREAGCPEEKLVAHYIGVDTERFSPGDPSERVPGRILAVGRLVPKKGLVHLLRAMPRVRARVPEAELLVAGDGPLREELERQSRELGAGARFLGVQTPEAVRDLMRTATVFCAPFVVAPSGNAEGLGLTQVEAQACGLPVVTTPSGGSPEALIHGETGFLSPAGDEEALAGRLLEILTDPDRAARFSRAAREHALRTFDLRTQSRKLEGIYDEAVEAARRDAGLTGG